MTIQTDKCSAAAETC